MDKYINLAELRKTAEALLYKINEVSDNVENKLDSDAITIVGDMDEYYNLELMRINNEPVKIPLDWINMNIEEYLYSNPPLPYVTSSDNGKVLRVVDGDWAAATLPGANGVSF